MTADVVALQAVAGQLQRRGCSLAADLGRRLDESLRTADALAATGAHEMAATMRAEALALGGWLVR